MNVQGHRPSTSLQEQGAAFRLWNSAPLANERLEPLAALRRRLQRTGSDIRALIKERQLYLRISVLGSCNLSCPFCHNEGAPKSGRLTLQAVDRIIEAGVKVGFTRIQFTGGEPLLNPEITEFVQIAKQYVVDVGITTNGTRILSKLVDLAKAGLCRLHVSLMVEPLIEAGSGSGTWGVPPWLQEICTICRQNWVGLRLNLPVSVDHFQAASLFMREMRIYAVDFKVFSLLPEGDCRNAIFPADRLQEIVDEENRERALLDISSRVLLRHHRVPVGLRCGTCSARDQCKEQSHSLRVGSDRILRPCLATRRWDAAIDDSQDLVEQMERAALLALDY
jgi:hypothetical protein